MEKKVWYNKENDNIIGVTIDNVYYSYDTIFDMYINKMMSIKELGAKFNLGKSSVSNILNSLKLSKNNFCNKDYRKSDIFQNQIKQRNLKKYGVEYACQSEEIKEKIKQSNLEKYGTEFSFQSEVVKNKIKQSMLDRYGVEHALQSKDILNKMYASNKEKYGYDNPFNSSSIQNKIKESNLKKYGCENPFSNKQIQEKIHNTFKEKYNVSIYKQKDMINLDIWNDDEKFIQLLEGYDHKPTTFELTEFFNCERTCILNKIHKLSCEHLVSFSSNRSHFEDEIIRWLSEELKIKKIINNDKKTLNSGKKEIDIYLPEYKFGIEFNGEYWHSELVENYQDHNGRSTKHQEKSLLAEEKGIFLFNIFEREWEDQRTQKIIKSRIKNMLNLEKNKIHGRKCVIKEITVEEKKKFLQENHIQGNDRSSIYIGLFYKDVLVSCMTFKKSKDNYSYELSRFCNLINCVIVGAASKLFKYFLKHYTKHGDTIVSYSDFSKAKGGLYNTLGFKYESLNTPNYWWINFETGDVRSRYQEQSAGEVKRMHDQNYYRVCDCGTKTWIYTV